MALLTPSLHAGVLNGYLDTYAQWDSAFSPGAYLEQSLGLDYRDHDWAGSLLAYVGGDEQHHWHELQYAYLEKRFPATKLELRIGRMLRYDALGAYQLDGVSLRQNQEGYVWEAYLGHPRRNSFPNHFAERTAPAIFLDSHYLAGLRLSGQFETIPLYWRLGTRYYWDGNEQWKLEGQLSGEWATNLPSPDSRAQLWAEIDVDARQGRLDALDVQLNFDAPNRHQWLLRGQYLQPHEPAANFRERFALFYGTARHSRLEISHAQQLTSHLQMQAGFQAIEQKTGLSGAGLDWRLGWNIHASTSLELHLSWLQAHHEHNAGIFLSYRFPFHSHLLGEINAAWRHERHHSYGDKQIRGLELRMEWMLSQRLYLKSNIEWMASHDAILENHGTRIGLRITYRLPSQGAEDYR